MPCGARQGHGAPTHFLGLCLVRRLCTELGLYCGASQRLSVCSQGTPAPPSLFLHLCFVLQGLPSSGFPGVGEHIRVWCGLRPPPQTQDPLVSCLVHLSRPLSWAHAGNHRDLLTSCRAVHAGLPVPRAAVLCGPAQPGLSEAGD